MQKNDWKDRLNMAYSTDPNFEYEYDEQEKQETLPKHKQQLRVSIEKKGRGGKVATLISNFVGTEEDLKDLARILKTKCGVGGSAKDDQILIQGELKTKVLEILHTEGYTQAK